MIKFNRRFDPHQIELLIFDLDGTLIDSRLDLVHSVNAMLRHFGRPELPEEVVASYVGDGAPMLIRRALGDTKDEKFVKQALDYFLGYYRVHKLDHTHVYQGIKESLAAIHGSNGVRRKMAVLSNKPAHPSRAIVRALGLDQFFFHVYGGNSFPTKKPDPEGARSLLK
ncbi:MAG TPA: HAD hydrolase-like protein, partial [Terriglobales bacterium]|nr:HAD hydrolase-like protein [Terriglobales bacterium]